MIRFRHLYKNIAALQALALYVEVYCCVLKVLYECLMMIQCESKYVAV